ncbi:MAG: nucleoside triphosphate pyrophosphohydrolase [Armatimonadota bacterium]
MMEKSISKEFVELVETVKKLRSREGCPWDRQQTHESLKSYLIEETYELVEAIDSGDLSLVKDELGDLLLQVFLHAQIADESGEFGIADVCRGIREKLQRRHPHVFGEVEVSSVDEVLRNWEKIKRAEAGYEDRTSVLDGIPRTLPALMRATKLSKRAARTGFEWPNLQAVVDKLKEEVAELEAALAKGDREEIRGEIGDLLFTIVNIARWVDVDPEDALRGMLKKFAERFRRIEEHARQTGRDITEMTLEEMDKVWNETK